MSHCLSIKMEDNEKILCNKYICKFGLYCHKYILELDLTFSFEKDSHFKSLLVKNVVGFSQWVSINKNNNSLAKRKKILDAYIFCHCFAKLNRKMFP